MVSSVGESMQSLPHPPAAADELHGTDSGQQVGSS